MLLVTFHGGAGGNTNVGAYHHKTGKLITATALQGTDLTDAELRDLEVSGSYLYVVNGKKEVSTVLCFDAKPSSKGTFTFVGAFAGPDLSKKKQHFKTSIAHPYALCFAAQKGDPVCFIANQDTNVVAITKVSGDGKTGKVQKGCRSRYLDKTMPKGSVFLDGTFVASQVGTLPDVDVDATDVPAANGGLAVHLVDDDTAAAPATPAGASGKKDPAKQKVQNSVRDVAADGDTLFVCDEPAAVVRVYKLTKGDYLGASAALAEAPTHLTIFAGGLYASAGDQLYWSALDKLPAVSFTSVLTAPTGFKVGGVSFDPKSGTAYVAFQKGTGGTGTGSVSSYALGKKPAAPPVFPAGTPLIADMSDTPEFVLYL